MAVNGGDITLSLGIDKRPFDSKLNEIKSIINGKLTSSFRKLGAVIAAAFSVTAVAQFGKEAVKAAMDLENAMQGVESIVSGQGRSFAQAKEFLQEYISDGLVPATDAATAYKNLAARGYDEEQIKNVMTALKDSAAYGRQSSLTLGQAVASAAEGLKNENSILVDNAGVTKNVAKMWQDYAKSIGVSVNSLTQQQKIQAEVNGIMTETQFQTGDAAKVANSFSGQLSQLSFKFNEFKVALGNAIIPVVQAVLPYITQLLDFLTELANKVGQFTSALFGTKSKQYDQTAKSASSAAKAENQLAQATTNAAESAEKSLASFDDLNVLQSNKNNDAAINVDAGTTASTLSYGGVSENSVVSDDLLKSIKSKIKALNSSISKAFAPTISSWSKAFSSLKKPFSDMVGSISKSASNLWGNTLSPLGSRITNEFVPGIVNAFSTNVAPIFSDVMAFSMDEFSKDFEFMCQQVDNATKDIIQPAMSFFQTVFTDAFNSIGTKWQEVGPGLLAKFGEFRESFREIWNSLYDNILKPVFDRIFEVLNWLWDEHLKPLWDNILDFFASLTDCIMTIWNNFLAPIVNWLIEVLGPIVSGVINTIIDVVGTIFGVISDVVGGILKALGGLLDFITGVFSGDWEKAWGGICDFFGGIWDAIWGIVKGIINFIIDALNLLWKAIYWVVSGIVNAIGGIAGAIGSLVGQDWSFSMPSDPPLIPKLARGAVLPPNREFLAVLGDQKHGRNLEAPEDLIRQIVREETQGTEIDVNVNFGGTMGQLVRLLYPEIKKEQRRSSAW